MTEEIIRKLAAELNAGVNSEVQVVYLLAGIRKLIERDKINEKYSGLKFHCDWALHAHLDRSGAKEILSQFDIAQPLLKAEGELWDLAPEIDRAITRISKMERFKSELMEFLSEYNLPPITQNRPDGWTHFLRYYICVIEDIPLVVKESSSSAATNISRITVHFESAKKTQKFGNREEQFYKVTWRIFDKTGESGEVVVISSFSV